MNIFPKLFGSFSRKQLSFIVLFIFLPAIEKALLFNGFEYLPARKKILLSEYSGDYDKK
jgi:hypothetical protein